jgi:hypothetical protein
MAQEYITKIILDEIEQIDITSVFDTLITTIEFDDNMAIMPASTVVVNMSFSFDAGAIYTTFEDIADSITRLATMYGVVGTEYLIRFQIKTLFTAEHIESTFNGYVITSIAANAETIDADSIVVTAIDVNKAQIAITPTKNAFKPYQDLTIMQSSIDRMLAIAEKINYHFGHQIVYFKCVTKDSDDSINYTFKTSLKYVVNDIKHLTVLVPDNDFVDNKIVYTDFNVEFDQDLIIHINVEEFHKVFGSGLRPEAKDYCYIPQIGRIYDVTSAHAKKEFMNTAVYHTVTLSKHIYSTDIDTDSAVNDTDFDIDTIRDFQIDSDDNTINAVATAFTEHSNLVVSGQHHEGIKAESLHLYSNHTYSDALRSLTHNLLEIVDNVGIVNGNTPIANKAYNMIYIDKETIAITYQLAIGDTDTAVTLGAWINCIKTNKHTILTIGNIKLYAHFGVIDIIDMSDESILDSVSIELHTWMFIALDITYATSLINLRILHIQDDIIDSAPLSLDIDVSLTHNNLTRDALVLYGGQYYISNIRLYRNLYSDTTLQQISTLKNAKIEHSIILDNTYTL